MARELTLAEGWMISGPFRGLARDKMTRDVITITPDQSLRMAKERLRKQGLRRLPVVRDGKLVGIVTDRDVRQAPPSPSTSLSTHDLLYLLDRVTVEGDDAATAHGEA